jgi:uncharacterized protein YbbC (DUF1343 family)
MVLTGLERVLRDPSLLSGSGRLGLLYNQGSVDCRFRSAAEALHEEFPDTLHALFGPQHGVALTEQDNMRETGHGRHATLGLPVYSLYSETRKPDPVMLNDVDTVVVDLQDVGTRVYTFATTIVYLMEAASAAQKAVVILERPNPVDGTHVEGNVLDPRYASFVGPYPIPMRHGMTLGELMLLYNQEYGIGCRLNVVPMSGWNRNDFFESTGLTWVMPSPNMPLVETAVVYPGQVILEGTNLSEGRGTTRPFEIFGAPFVDPAETLAEIEEEALAGAVLREVSFKPTFNKWTDALCRGFQIHVTDRSVYRPYRCTLAILSAMLRLYPEQFRWSDPPYEYVYDKLPADVILGDDAVRRDLELGRSVTDMEKEWQPELDKFMKVRARFLLY